MDPEEEPPLVFQYHEDEEGASCMTNMTDEQVVEILEQFIRRDTGETMH